MIEKELSKLLKESEEIRLLMIDNGEASYYNDAFINLSKFISDKLNSSLFKKRNAKIIANHFDEILPYMVSSNSSIFLLGIDSLIEQPNFKEKFIEGLKKYPYKEGVDQIFYYVWSALNSKPGIFDEFIDEDMLKLFSTMDLDYSFYSDMLNRLNEDNQRKFLNILVENKNDIPYSGFEYKGNNKQIIYDNLDLYIDNAQNLYALMDFVKEDPVALSKVKDYIDNNEDKAINSIFCQTTHSVKIKDPTLREVIKLIVLDVMKNENVKFSEITYNGGGFSRILLVGDKVIKLGNRATKEFPNNPYIISPLLRRELEYNNEKCFAEVTERAETGMEVSEEELYQLFKNLRDIGLVWTDIKAANVGRLRNKNVIHWRDNLEPSDGVLSLEDKRGSDVLDKGDLVLIDADFIYDEKDPNIDYSNCKFIHDKFEQRYQEEKKQLKKMEEKLKVGQNMLVDITNQEEHMSIRR